MAKAVAIEQATGAPRRRRLPRKLIILGIVLLVIAALVGAGLLVARNLNGPASGTIVKSVPDEGIQQPAAQVEFDGTTFSFVHPQTYVEQQVKPNPGDIEDRVYLSTVMNGGYLNIAVTPFANTSLSDNASYSMRESNPNKYQRKLVMVRGEQVTIFTANDGQQLQQTAFWPHAGKLMTFSLTGVATDVSSSQSEFLSMVESLSWR